MFDELKEKASTLSKVGSFYTSTITDKDRYTAHKLSHTTYNTNLFKQFNSLKTLLTGVQYFNNKFLLIKFKDKDIKYGYYQADNAAEVPSLQDITIYPDELQGDTSKITLIGSDKLAFILTIPSDLYIRVIQLSDGSVLAEGINFKSQFGKIIFTESPISLFNSMEFLALSYTERKRNILCYPLQLQDVYGDVSYVISYYRNNQSLSQFKKALYQAASIPVAKYREKIVDLVKLSNGVSYITNSGIHYDADFPHTQLNIGDTLEKDQVIGGEEFLKVYLPGDTLPSDIEALNIQSMSMTGGKSLYVYNSDSVLYIDNVFQPQNFAKGEGSQYYTAYVNKVGSLSKVSASIPDRMNCIDFLRNVVTANRCIILQVDKEKMPYDISMKLKSFIIDHAPIGSVIAYSDGEPPAEPEPEPPAPTIVTINGELTKGETQTGYRGSYHAFAFKISDSDGIITWNKQIDSASDITINNITLATPDLTSSSTTIPARLALYQADESRFIAVSDAVEWQINTTCTFTFGEDAKVKFTDRLMFVFVHPDTPQEQLINPVNTDISVEDDDFTLAAWYIKLMSDGTSQSYPSNWGVISSSSLNSTNRRYMPVFTMQIQQTV